MDEYEYDDDYFDDGYCDICNEDWGLESHYHCSVCLEQCSMMGHSSCLEKEISG